MYTYKRIIRCKNTIEIEYYQSIRQVGKYYGGRDINRSLSSAKQKKANEIRTTLKWQRIIDCNWDEGDCFCRFSAPFGTFDDEQTFMKAIRNWMDRIKRRCKKKDIEFKYLGFRECGKLGKNWHLHIILSDAVRKIAQECWKYKSGMNFTPLYADGNYEKLADYIHKDVCGSKRIMVSRNLLRPQIETKKATKKEIRRIEKGLLIDIPQGYYLSKDDPLFDANNVTGATWYFKFIKLDRRKYKN